MKNETRNPNSTLISEGLDLPKDVRIIRPISIDLFLTGQEAKSNLPSDIVTNPVLLEQAALRRKLHSEINRFFEQVDDVTLDVDVCIDRGLVATDEVVGIYEGLSDFIEDDVNNARILLYLPSQLLPDLNNVHDQPEELSRAKTRFKNIYYDAWIMLCHETDPRANFVDGDVLEPGLPEPEMISKAGHLMVDILEKGLVSAVDLVNLLDIVSDPRIIKSLSEGAIVARDKGLIGDTDWGKMVEIINKKKQSIKLGPIRQAESSFEEISPKRARWLMKVQKEKAVNSEAAMLSKKMEEAGLPAVDLSIADSNTDYWKTVALGIIKAGESLFVLDSRRSLKLADQTHTLFKKLLAVGNPEIADILTGGLNRWGRRGIVGKEYLHELGIKMPDLSSLSPLDSMEIVTDFSFITDASKRIQEDHLLSQALYPIFLVFGSRLKGYADKNADYDAAMFFRPGAKPEDREQILSRLTQLAPKIGRMDKLLEYWMTEIDGKLEFRQLPENPLAIGPEQVHFFLGGAWISQGSEYTRIYEEILWKYLDMSRLGDQKEATRSELLGRIELDVLQYRLLHRGYRKLYPRTERQGTQYSTLIDWESDYWDPGYRRIATQLFLSRVFLPDLS